MRILHSADIHLDAPFAGRTAEEAAYLRRELLAVPGKLADICLARQCDMALLAGDLFDGGVISCYEHQIKPDKEIYETLIQPPLAQDLVHGAGILLLQGLQIGHARGRIHPVAASAAAQQHRRRQHTGPQPQPERRFFHSFHVSKTAFRKINHFIA